MATGVISRKPNDIVRPTCSKFSCLTTFEIPYRDRMRARYCPTHDQTGYWASKRPQTFFEVDGHENIARAKINGKWHTILSVSVTGKRILVALRVNTKPFGVSVSDVEDWAGIG